ncbi:nitrate/nitrite transporter NrtS [Paracoccaceae bacterium]|nr:nitrate/nitrite transporter NrtS [Paracoccaceae bacterium]
MILKKGIIKRAFFTSVAVGSVLLLINHGDGIKIQEYPALWKVGLTYLVPFLVTIWGSISLGGK